jgi:hypothetical protein
MAAMALWAAPAQAASPQPLIVGGTTVASAAEAPWAARIIITEEGGVGLCSGSIIDPQRVVTAAHCISGDRPASYEVVAGDPGGPESAEEEGATQRRFAVSARISPGYVPDAIGHSDAAVLTVDPPFDFSGPEVRPIAVVPESGGLAYGSPARIFGWGMVEFGRLDGREHSLLLSLIPQWRCAGGLPAAMCGQASSGSICKGDSGGGLVSTGNPPLLLGVASFGHYKCQPGTQGGYANLATPELHRWLEGDPDPPPAPVTEEGAFLLGNTSVGGVASCLHPSWANAEELRTLFVFPESGRQVEVGEEGSYFSRPADVGQLLGCVSVARGEGGVTESGLSQIERIAGHSNELLRLRRRFRRGDRWVARLALAAPLLGDRLKVKWKARGCSSRGWTFKRARRLTVISSPRGCAARPLMKVRVPQATVGDVVYRTSTFRLRL